MKRLKLFFACLLMAVLSIGQMWGAVYFEDTFSDVGTGSSGSMLPRDGWSGSGTTAPQYNTGVRLGASSSGATLTKAAMSNIEGTKSLKVTIYVSRYNTNANTLTVTATNGTIASATLAENVSTGSGLTDGTLTIKPSANAGVTSTTAAATWTDAYKTEFTITGASKTTTITFSSSSRLILGPVKIEDAASTPSTCTSEITITKADDPANGTFALDNSGTVCIDEGNAIVNVTATPAAHYHLASVTSTAGTIGSIAGNTCEITDIDADTEIGVTFAEDTKYVVTWNVNGNEDTKTNVYAGEKPVFPATPAACDATSTTFIGWATAPWTGKLADLSEKTVYTSASAMPDVDAAVTYYAVFAKSSGSASNLFSWAGGTKEELTAAEGVADLNADNSDYADTHAPYRVKWNGTGKYIIISVASQPGQVSAGFKMIGGGTTSTITVQEADDAEGPFTDVENLAISGSSNDVVNIESTQAFKSTTRAIKLYYTKGSNVGLGPISIEGAVSMSDYMTTCCTQYNVNIAAGIENGSVSADVAKACEGATITLTFTPAFNYHLSAWTLNGAAQDVNANTFSMPAGAATVSATFEQDACEPLATPVVTVSGKAYPYDAVKLAWTAIEHADAYKVYIYDNEDNELEHNDAFAGVEYTIGQTLSASTTYKYFVQAISNTPATYCPSVAATGSFVTEALPTAHLTLIDLEGEHASSGDYPILTPFALPTEAASCSKEFYGWTSTENYSSEDVAPEYKAGDNFTFANTTGVTLYAVYADETPGAATLTKLNGSSMPVAGDKIVIVGIDTNDDSKHALYQETSGSSYVKHWAFDNNVATVAADAKKYVTLEAANDGKFYLGDATNGYVYSSGSNNLSVDLTNKTAWTIAWDADASAFTFNQGRYLSCRSDLTGDNTYLYRLAGGTPAGIWKLDVYKYGTSASTFSNYATTCPNLLDNPTFSLDPVVAPVNDKYEEAINVVITNNAGEGTIYYTTNGENPTSASDEYTAPIALNTCGTKTVKAIVISATNHSEVVTATYEMAIPIPAVSEADPYTEAEAVAVIDGGCYNNEDVYVTGTVASNGAAWYQNSGTYTITLENGFKFYYFYEGANEQSFTDNYIAAGDVLVAKGKLEKSGNAYRLAQGCYLVSRTPAQKTPIDSDIDNPITVADALGYIDQAATYDLTNVYVKGVASEDPDNQGTFNIHDADVDNTFQIYKGVLSQALIDAGVEVEENDTVIAVGKLTKYYSTYEMAEGGEIVVVKKYVAPTVAVTGVEVDETATVKVGKTVQLTATVQPTNATNQNVTWSVKAGSKAFAEVSETGLVTGLAEGVAIIIVTTEDGGFTDECTVTVNPIAPANTDIITAEGIGVEGNSYMAWTGKTGFGTSSVYAGNSTNATNPNAGALQLRYNTASDKQSGIVLTESNGMVLKGLSVSVKTGSNTLNVYAKATAYSGYADLYSDDEDVRGKLIGTVSATGAMTLEEGVSYDDNYQYIGMRSANGALYLNDITITWGEPVVPPTVYTVTFNTDGGSTIDPVDVEEGQAVAKPADPTKDDYNFVEWQLNGVAYDFTAAVTANITLDAVWEPVTPPEPSYTEVRNGLTEGWYYTMCLDKAVTAVKAGSIWRVLSKAANGTDVILEEVTGTLQAGRPYIFLAAANTLEVAYTGDAVGAPVTEDNNGLIGSFSQTEIAQSPNNFIIYNNELYYVNSEKVYVGANRAYLDMTGVPAYSNEPQQGNAPRRRVVMTVHGEQTATGCENINASETPVKMIINGQLYILRGEKLYDATGKLVK